ncbi:MAG TPA: beta-N-acetylhexosaminidase [Blastocatellia bacterium]|nr:beta-N-acetylhexosaminidase [Blastocatellia bacterium]
MEIEHRVGQLILIGVPGTEVDAEARDLLESVQPGGVLLSARNIESPHQVLELTTSIRAAVQVPPLIAVDQEGGRVDRLREIYSAMPSADLVRASGDASMADRLGEITAEGLRMLGFNVNLAPVLDVAVDDSAENGLKGRYFGDSAAQVVRLAGAYLEGLQRGGVVGAGKHFPGLGATLPDSHSDLPSVDLTRDQVLRHHVAPYTELFSKINARLNALLVAHAHYPAFDGPSPLPASLSKNIVTGLLRDELGFKGLAITDDLEMGAITSARSVGDAAVMAIEAGLDMVMVTGTTESAVLAWQTMTTAAREGRILKTSISRAFDHIARVKAMLSPPHSATELGISRLRERIAEMNRLLQHSK